MYCIFSFAVIGFDEVYSLWAATSPHYGWSWLLSALYRLALHNYVCTCYNIGGLGFTLYQIGISLSAAGTLMLPTNLFIFPLVSNLFVHVYYVH